ncbi:G-protein coupled estrogen receptor 1-like protein [Lates japonicus]|uniref:G-protein coupled estrogen receptor 1-like protein n=1 Tax=Lates japonicus TaxID=270547 RepID=A0AAD3RJ73_LATJO|nr:G-protein coupled estrogen receptor 1-like protein [Lates japonicus]
MTWCLWPGYRVITGRRMATVYLNDTQAVVSDFLQTASENHQRIDQPHPLRLYIILFLSAHWEHPHLSSEPRTTGAASPGPLFQNSAAGRLALVADSLIEVFNLKQG